MHTPQIIGGLPEPFDKGDWGDAEEKNEQAAAMVHCMVMQQKVLCLFQAQAVGKRGVSFSVSDQLKLKLLEGFERNIR